MKLTELKNNIVIYNKKITNFDSKTNIHILDLENSYKILKYLLFTDKIKNEDIFNLYEKLKFYHLNFSLNIDSKLSDT